LSAEPAAASTETSPAPLPPWCDRASGPQMPKNPAKTSDCRETERLHRLTVRPAVPRPRRNLFLSVETPLPGPLRRPIPPSIAPSPDPHHVNACRKPLENRPIFSFRGHDAPRHSPAARGLAIPNARMRAFKKKSLVRAQFGGRKAAKTSPLSAPLSSNRAKSSPPQAKTPKKLAHSPKLPIVTSVFASRLKHRSPRC
jgi:hypothetical protein